MSRLQLDKSNKKLIGMRVSLRNEDLTGSISDQDNHGINGSGGI